MRFNPSGNSKVKVISDPLAGELRYLYTSQSLLEGYFQRYSFFSFSSLLYEDSRTSLVTRESPLAKLKKKKKCRYWSWGQYRLQWWAQGNKYSSGTKSICHGEKLYRNNSHLLSACSVQNPLHLGFYFPTHSSTGWLVLLLKFYSWRGKIFNFFKVNEPLMNCTIYPAPKSKFWTTTLY